MANIYKASVTGLGNESPTSQVYTKDDGFPTSFEEVTDNKGNIFIKIPTMYRKVDSVVDNQITAFTMSTAKVDDTYEPYSVFVKPDGSIMPYVLIGKYCTNSSTSMTSIAASSTTLTIGNARAYAQALGTGYQQYDWQFQKLFQDLALLISQKVNFQDGSAAISEYLGIYDLKNQIWVDGVSRDSTTWCIAYDPDKYVDSATSSTDGYVSAGYSAPTTSSEEIKLLGYSTSNPFFNYPKVTVSNSSYNTYYCDYYSYRSGNRPVRSYVGAANADNGLWNCGTYNSLSISSSARLCYRPLDETVQETPTILIKNPLTLFTSATKVVGTDLVVNASEVEVVEEEEEVQIGNLIYAQTSAWTSYPINRQFEIGMTWEEFINSDYNKVQQDYAGGNGDYIEGQFILDDDEVKFYGRLYDHYYGWDPEYHTLNVYDGFATIYGSDIIESDNEYDSDNSGIGGSN